MAKHYSRFANSEERKNTRKAYYLLFLTGLTLVLLFFFGLPLVIRFAAFLSEIRGSSIPIEIIDTTPPAPPQLENLPEATNKSFLEIIGQSESGATVFIFLNQKSKEIIADDEGKFTTKLPLLDGENIIYAYARDKAGNEGQKTREFNIIFDDEEPKLEISSPAEGAQFSGSTDQKITILGLTDPDVNLTINDSFVSVNDEGNFLFTATLSEGDNVFTLKAQDAAGNSSEKTLTLKYSP